MSRGDLTRLPASVLRAFSVRRLAGLHIFVSRCERER